MRMPITALYSAVCVLVPCTQAITPVPEEFAACRAWSGLVLGPTGEAGFGSWLRLLNEDAPDSITRGRSWRGTPYQLGDKTYSHGLAFNSTKQLLVHLGSPGRAFRADVGLENNDDTIRGEAIGQGSVTFHVRVANKEVFSSRVLRRKDGPKPLQVELHGAREFEIQVKDGGDGRGWDQALWAEAEIQLEDGTTLRLQDLPFPDDSANRSGFSFRYGGIASSELLPRFTRSAKKSGSEELAYLDPQTGLELRVEVQQFSDFPAVEWVLHLKNTSQTNTPMLESIQALDSVIPLALAGPAQLHWSKGAVASFEDFEPQSASLKPGAKLRLQPGGGRSSSQVLPFFNIEGANGGIIAAVGWSGEWAVEFASDSRNQVRMKAGMARTHLSLHPGESIRTPRMLLLFYSGDRWRGQNLLRQFILTHHRPQPNGKPMLAPITCGNWGGTHAEVHLDNIRQIAQHKLPLEYYWIDAEWFGTGGWPINVGNWEVKRDLYPSGFKPISEALRKDGRELLLWFEPERVYRDTPWHRQHGEWLLKNRGDSSLLNLGNPEARKFLIDFISARIQEYGLGCYRQDFNIDPLPFWQAADAPDRQGITEIRYIEGLYAFWDELLKRNPGLIIDNCASGGRRIDLETVGRATPFWRTDGPRDAIAHQCHTYGLMAWVPLSATSQDRAGDNYEFRSSMCSSLCLNWWISGDVPADRIRPDFPFAWARTTLDSYLQYRQFYYGDYYPLTSYSRTEDVWMAYQLDHPDMGQGMVVVLRRPGSPYESASFPLRGLAGTRQYLIKNLDTGEETRAAGEALTRSGLPVKITDRPGSALLVYKPAT